MNADEILKHNQFDYAHLGHIGIGKDVNTGDLLFIVEYAIQGNKKRIIVKRIKESELKKVEIADNDENVKRYAYE